MSYLLGLSAFYHDSSAVLLKNDQILSAVQEERFTRIKHDPAFPSNCIKSILNENKLKLDDIDKIIFYEKPFLKFERLLETHLAFAPRGFKSFCASMPIWLREKLFQKKLIGDYLKSIDKKFDINDKLLFSEHHLSHAASAFYPSPFENAIILTLDGVGEWATTTVALGQKNKIKILKEINFPHSIGLLYSAFTYYLGFKVNSGEYKVMGLAPYGTPKYKDKILNNLLDLKEDGSFRINMKYFNYATGLTMINNKFIDLFGQKIRSPEKDKLTQFHMDIAASIQSVIEYIILKIVKNLSLIYKFENLCLAGGVALNCVANGKILKEKFFKNIWIQPAAGDAGGSLGAPLYYWYDVLGNQREYGIDMMSGSYLGPSYNSDEIRKKLNNLGANYEEFSESDLLKLVAKELSNEKAVGWFQGKMEFGPRSLGSRSIIADPRSNKMQKNLNLKVKFRESFRPFAPAVLREKVKEYFDIDCDSPYMLLVAQIQNNKKKEMSEEAQNLFGIEKLNVVRSEIPAVTHVDYSARIQTVDIKTNKKFHDLISEFEKITNVPVLVNTSFNIRGEPIVCNIEDAYNCFMGTDLDILVLENFVLYKNKQAKNKKIDYKNKFKLD